MTEAQSKRLIVLNELESLTTAQQTELNRLLALKQSESEVKKEITPEIKPEVINGFMVNGNFNGIDEKTAVEKVGLKYATPKNLILLVYSVQLVVNGDRKFYSIKADNAINDEALDVTISEHHYKEWNFAEILPVGNYAGKPVKVKGIFASPEYGYYDKKKSAVVKYWKSGFFIIELRSDADSKEVTNRRKEESNISSFMKTLELLLGESFDRTNAEHLEVLKNLQR